MPPALCVSLQTRTNIHIHSHTDIAGLQQPDGSFAGDQWGEIDTRFTYAALLACSILGRMGALAVDKAVEFVVACKNFDGGFGCTPGERQARGCTAAGLACTLASC